MHTVTKLEDPDRHVSILLGLGSRDYPSGGTESAHAAHPWHALPRFEDCVCEFDREVYLYHPWWRNRRVK